MDAMEGTDQTVGSAGGGGGGGAGGGGGCGGCGGGPSTANAESVRTAMESEDSCQPTQLDTHEMGDHEMKPAGLPVATAECSPQSPSCSGVPTGASDGGSAPELAEQQTSPTSTDSMQSEMASVSIHNRSTASAAGNGRLLEEQPSEAPHAGAAGSAMEQLAQTDTTTATTAVEPSALQSAMDAEDVGDAIESPAASPNGDDLEMVGVGAEDEPSTSSRTSMSSRNAVAHQSDMDSEDVAEPISMAEVDRLLAEAQAVVHNFPALERNRADDVDVAVAVAVGVGVGVGEQPSASNSATPRDEGEVAIEYDLPPNDVVAFEVPMGQLDELPPEDAVEDDLQSNSSTSDLEDARDIREQPRINVPGNYVHSIVEELMQLGRNPENGFGDVVRRDHLRHRIQRVLFSLQRNRRYPTRNTTAHNDAVGEQEDAEAEVLPDNPISFDTNLPTEHSYMGANMDRVSGVNYLDVGQRYYMMIFMHEHTIFPGEVLPFMISSSIFADAEGQNGALFGISFPFLCNADHGDNIYGVTCQIYEKGTDERGNTLIKSRALQRFVADSSEFTVPLHFLSSQPKVKSHGYVKILPETYLPEPLSCIDMGSMNRFRDIPSMGPMFRRFQAATTVFPPYVYERYNITSIVENARKQLAQHKIDTMPTDPTQLSYWLVRNLHLSEGMMRRCFLTNSVNKRMLLIGRTLKEESIFTCRYCGHSIANCSELFAMSKHGVQTHYCNSAGYIHETNTVYALLQNAILYSGEASTMYSWFPGYEWRIIVCKICTRHIGWKFTATEPNLVPKKFYGISSSSVRVTSTGNIPTEGSDIYRTLLRLTSERE